MQDDIPAALSGVRFVGPNRVAYTAVSTGAAQEAVTMKELEAVTMKGLVTEALPADLVRDPILTRLLMLWLLVSFSFLFLFLTLFLMFLSLL